MSLRYVTTNLINSTTLPDNTYVSTEDETYLVANLYNKRPSRPFRFTARAAQTIKVELAAKTAASFVGIFNHNIPDGETLNLQGADADAGYVAVTTPTWREKDVCSCFRTVSWTWWLLNVGVQVGDPLPQIGEFVLGSWIEFADAWVQPGRKDGPAFYVGRQKTHYGQEWATHLSNTERFSIQIKNLNNPAVIDDLQTFLVNVFENSDGKFILIPDHTKPHCYYVQVTNDDNFANREIYGTNELRNWRLELETLTRGITLL